ncbi:MAG: 30S ribosomal protein S20 [Proteobacteria bacterium]|nr:30S ribosomal protein S20 [Pseudomonadota bacterium]
MANTKQAAKRARQNTAQREENRARRSRLRTAVKAFETAVTGGDKAVIGTAFTAAMSELHRGVSKGVMKQGTANRTISRMAARIRSLQA